MKEIFCLTWIDLNEGCLWHGTPTHSRLGVEAQREFLVYDLGIDDLLF
jgi:hypothetical protein